MLQKLIVFVSPCIAGILGMVAFTKLSLIFRLACIQVWLYVAVLYVSYQIPNEYIHGLYNFYMPVETGLLLGGVYVFFKGRTEQQWAVPTFTVFLLVYVVQVFVTPTKFANYASVVEGMVMLGAYLMIIKAYLDRPGISLWRMPLFYFCIGGAVYFGGTAPLLSIFQFANKNFLAENAVLFKAIVDSLANIRYLMLALSLWLCLKPPKAVQL